MSLKLIDTSSDDTDGHKVFSLEIIKDNKTYYNDGIRFWVEASRVDVDAKALSLLVPEGSVRLHDSARIRAQWVNGVRTVTRDMRDFYTMSDEEYEATKFLCSTSYKMV